MQSEIDISNEHINEFCRRWLIDELSVIQDRAKHSPAADPGLRVKFDPLAEWSFAERLRMQGEFQLLSGREVRLHWKSRPARLPRHPMRVLYNY